MTFKIGDRFSDFYPPEAALWCNSNGAYLSQDERGWYEILSVPVPSLEEQNTSIEVRRQNLYTQLIDPLTNRKIRKTALNEWSEMDEAGYIGDVVRLTNKIKNENPYVD